MDYRIHLPKKPQWARFSRNEKIAGGVTLAAMALTILYSRLSGGFPDRARIEGNRIALDGRIEFDYDSANLRPGSESLLNDVVFILRSNPAMRVEVQGHTDNAGADDYNLRLSHSRAYSVLDYLRTKRVINQLSARGYGETTPIATNDTNAGRQTNRRVEFAIIG